MQHRTGQNHAIHLVGFQLAFQLAYIGFSRIAQQQVIPALGRHVPHTAHALAQERQVQPHKMLGDHQRKVVGWVLLRSAQRRSGILAALADISNTRARVASLTRPLPDIARGLTCCFILITRLRYFRDGHFITLTCHSAPSFSHVAQALRTNNSICVCCTFVNLQTAQKKPARFGRLVRAVQPFQA